MNAPVKIDRYATERLPQDSPRRAMPDRAPAEALLPASRHGIVLSCRRLRHSFGDRVVIDDVSFDVFAGQAYGLTGPYGSGKTTAVRIACGLMTADRGSVLLEGRPIDQIDGPSLRRSVSYMAQNTAAFPSLTVVETVRFWARLVGLPRAVSDDRTAEVLATAGIEGHGATPVDRCSGGVLRELSLAVALLHRPRLLVLDEPTLGIDGQSKERLLTTLIRLRDAGTAMLYASRDAAEVRLLCNRFGLLDRRRPAEGHRASHCASSAPVA
ncbi:ABC transporter ATP-binding protein [Streptosporangium sp. NPDC051023]|uniref:ABC transporter ATP-binding protein n=1 Tax=Streptosporangium sp. NPDC051023 TaxID=3155410 RepID=UPI00345081E7